MIVIIIDQAREAQAYRIWIDTEEDQGDLGARLVALV